MLSASDYRLCFAVTLFVFVDTVCAPIKRLMFFYSVDCAFRVVYIRRSRGQPNSLGAPEVVRGKPRK